MWIPKLEFFIVFSDNCSKQTIWALIRKKKKIMQRDMVVRIATVSSGAAVFLTATPAKICPIKRDSTNSCHHAAASQKGVEFDSADAKP